MLDFTKKVLPQICDLGSTTLQADLHSFEDNVFARTRPAVLASRQACLDAHDWQGLSLASPLLTRRQMMLDFDDWAPK